MHEYSTGWPALYGPPQMYGTAQQVPAADPLSSGSFPGTTTPSATLGSVNMKQKTFEELQEQVELILCSICFAGLNFAYFLFCISIRIPHLLIRRGYHL